jgi:hypothetical protein
MAGPPLGRAGRLSTQHGYGPTKTTGRAAGVSSGGACLPTKGDYAGNPGFGLGRAASVSTVCGNGSNEARGWTAGVSSGDRGLGTHEGVGRFGAAECSAGLS